MLRYLVRVLVAVTIGAATASAPAEESGTLRGRFVYDAKPPEPKKIVVDKDVKVCGKHPLLDESLVVGKDRSIANVVVYVRTPEVKVHPDRIKSVRPKVTLDNDGCRFKPHILPLWVGKQTLVLHNSDPVSHNARLQPFGDKGINPLILAGKSFEHDLKKEQRIPIPVICKLHPWMKGYVLARNTPYVAVSGKDGVFKIDKLPLGELEFQVWHERAGYVAIPEWKRGRFTVKIDKGVRDLGDITLPAKLFKKK